MAQCGDRKVFSAEEASRVGRECKTLDGNLHIVSRNDTGDLVFAGLEEVKGSIWVQSICFPGGGDDDHDNASAASPDEGGCPSWDPWKLVLPTLRTIQGHLVVRSYRPGKAGFRSLEAPRLRRVGEDLLVDDGQLALLDVSDLREVGRLEVDAPALDELRHDALEAVTGGQAPRTADGGGGGGGGGDLTSSVVFRRLGKGVKDLDSFTTPTINLPNIELRIESGLERVTIGYKKLGSLVLGSRENRGGVEEDDNGDQKHDGSSDGDGDVEFGTLIFGTNETLSSMSILNITSLATIGRLVRSPGLEKLTAGEFRIDGGGLGEWGLPFDSLAALRLLDISAPEKISLPEQAAGWTGFTFQVRRGPMRFASEYAVEDGNRTKTWHWPETSLDTIDLQDVAIDSNFFNSLLIPGMPASEGRRVTRLFRLISFGGSLNCGQFDEMRDSGYFPPVAEGFKTDDGYEGYYCDSLSNSSWQPCPPQPLFFLVFLCAWLVLSK